MRLLIVIAALLLTACPSKPNKPPKPADLPETPAGEVFESGDRVQQMLRDRVRSKFSAEDDFQVYVTEAGYPIGTLMREGRTVALNRASCAPSFEVGRYSLPNMFNSILMRGKAAFDLGLDSLAVAELARFGVKAGQEDLFNLSVGNAAGQFLLDDELGQLLQQQSCAEYLRGKTLLLVRGYVVGKRNYRLQRDRNAGADIGVTKVGGLKVEASGASGISLEDEAPTEFLQIVSKVRVPGPTVSMMTQPPPPGTIGPVYLQRDVNDSSGNAARLKDLLGGRSFAVIPDIDAIESDKMPAIAQVRFFNRSDEAAAERAVAILRQVYPSAAKLFIGLKAPKGQLEVWLPRAGG